MRNLLKSKFTFIALVPCVGAVAFLNGCGGGGGGGGSSLPTVPTPYDGTYAVTYTPTDKVPSDGKAPTGTLVVTNGRANVQTSYYLQPSVVQKVQDAIDSGLTKAGYPGDIKNNQVPSTINFSGATNLDATGKAVVTLKKSVNVCGTATLVVTPTLVTSGSGTANYQIAFPDKLSLKVRGTTQRVAGTCNNLPLRSGKVTFVRTSPTPTITATATATTTATAAG